MKFFWGVGPFYKGKQKNIIFLAQSESTPQKKQKLNLPRQYQF